LFENRRFFARQGDRIVGSIGFSFRRPGTPDVASFAPYTYAWGGVLKAFRGRRVATTLLRPLLDFMTERGKTTATMGTHLPDGHRFLRAIGAVEKLRVVENRMRLAGVDWSELARWEAQADAQALQWEIHAGRIRGKRLSALGPGMNDLIADVPLGSLDLPRMRYEKPATMAWYEEMDRRGGEHLAVLLMQGETLVGLTEASWDARFPDRVDQMLTGVARPWRGKGLAKSLKAALLRLIRERHPEVGLMITGNAEMNEAIRAINTRLGFFVHKQHVYYQISRDALGVSLDAAPARA
jgi:RimJ/RimL family protein N-acetyltransferase